MFLKAMFFVSHPSVCNLIRIVQPLLSSSLVCKERHLRIPRKVCGWHDSRIGRAISVTKYTPIRGKCSDFASALRIIQSSRHAEQGQFKNVFMGLAKLKFVFMHEPAHRTAGLGPKQISRALLVQTNRFVLNYLSEAELAHVSVNS